MNKDVLICIKGLHFNVSDKPDDLEVILPGQYYKRGDMHYLIYEEPIEGTEQVSKNMIKFNESGMTLNKKGLTSTSMFFNPSEKNLTNYNTPFGSLVIGIDTHSLDYDISDAQITLNVKYSLDINYEFLSECSINIIAKDAENTSF